MQSEIIQEKVEEIEHLNRVLGQERDHLKDLQKKVADLKEEITNLQGKLQKTKKHCVPQ